MISLHHRRRGLFNLDFLYFIPDIILDFFHLFSFSHPHCVSAQTFPSNFLNLLRESHFAPWETYVYNLLLQYKDGIHNHTLHRWKSHHEKPRPDGFIMNSLLSIQKGAFYLCQHHLLWKKSIPNLKCARHIAITVGWSPLNRHLWYKVFFKCIWRMYEYSICCIHRKPHIPQTKLYVSIHRKVTQKKQRARHMRSQEFGFWISEFP